MGMRPQNQPQNLKSLQPQNLKSLQPQNLKSLQPQNLKSLQPQNLKSLQPQNLKSLQPQNLKSPEPQNPKSPEPQKSKSLKPQNLNSLDLQNPKSLDLQNRRVSTCRTRRLPGHACGGVPKPSGSRGAFGAGDACACPEAAGVRSSQERAGTLAGDEDPAASPEGTHQAYICGSNIKSHNMYRHESYSPGVFHRQRLLAKDTQRKATSSAAQGQFFVHV